MSQPQIKVKLDCVRPTSNGSNLVGNAMIPVVATVTTSANALGVTSVVISNTPTGPNSTTITHVPSSVITSGSIVKENLHHLQVQPQTQQQHSLGSTIVSSGTSVIHPIQSTTSKQPNIITSSSAATVVEHANSNSIIVTTKGGPGATGPVTFGSGVTSAFTSTNNNIPLIACPVPLPSSSNNNSNVIINSHTYTLTNNNSNGNSSSCSSSGNNNGSNLCCLTEDGSRCSRVAGNASYSKRIQKTVQQKRLKLSIDSSARHIYICDHHKGMIQSIRTTGPSSAVNASNGPSDRAQRKRKHTRLEDFDDAMVPSPTDLDDIGDSVVGTGGKDPVSGVDLGILALGTLRRYKKHFHVPAKPGINKQQLAESVLKHFKSIKVNEKEAIAFFLYMVKSGRNKLDKGTLNDQMNHN